MLAPGAPQEPRLKAVAALGHEFAPDTRREAVLFDKGHAFVAGCIVVYMSAAAAPSTWPDLDRVLGVKVRVQVG